MKRFRNRILIICIIIMSALNLFGQFDGVVGTEGCQAISRNNPAIIGWATGCELRLGYQDIAARESVVSYGAAENAIGMASNNYAEVVSLGDSGVAILTFDIPISNGAGYDFAVFENSFDDYFLELAFVEVSSDGLYWVRFPAISNTQTETQVDGYGQIDAALIHNLAGKYRGGWGTPFDLEELTDDTQLDLNNIRYVKVIDVVGSIDPQYASYDSQNQIINDPYPTYLNSGGFDLSGVAIMNGWRPTAISTISKTLSYKVYPNPCVDYVNITMPEQETTLRLYNIQGMLLWQENSSEEEVQIDMQHYSPGVYVLSIGSFKTKIVKN